MKFVSKLGDTGTKCYTNSVTVVNTFHFLVWYLTEKKTHLELQLKQKHGSYWKRSEMLLCVLEALFSEKNTLYLSLLLAKTNIAKIVTVAFLAMCAIEECKLAQRNVLLGDLKVNLVNWPFGKVVLVSRTEVSGSKPIRDNFFVVEQFSLTRREALHANNGN